MVTNGHKAHGYTLFFKALGILRFLSDFKTLRHWRSLRESNPCLYRERVIHRVFEKSLNRTNRLLFLKNHTFTPITKNLMQCYIIGVLDSVVTIGHKQNLLHQNNSQHIFLSITHRGEHGTRTYSISET